MTRVDIITTSIMYTIIYGVYGDWFSGLQPEVFVDLSLILAFVLRVQLVSSRGQDMLS
jgi:hypothetical protein